MMYGDGAYSDARWRAPNEATIAVVLHEGGEVVFAHRKSLTTKNNTEAECAAAEWARTLYPDRQIYCDCTTAADRFGGTWIPRGENYAAHLVAAGIPILKLPVAIKGIKKFRDARFRRWQGRGCQSA